MGDRSRRKFVRALAQSLLAGSWNREALRQRTTQALDGGPPAPAKLADRLLDRLGQDRAPSPHALERAIAADNGFARAWGDRYRRPVRLCPVLSSPVMDTPINGLECETLPSIPTAGDLARWLGISFGELDWLADCQGRNAWLPPGPLAHYFYRWRPREGRYPRLIEIPKECLKGIQRRILRDILDRVPPHNAAHGFRAEHSCLSYAAPHSRRQMVARMDLTAFFPSIHHRRVLALFRSLGYPYTVARLLTGLCVHRVAACELQRNAANLPLSYRQQLAAPHLPQGAPTSPALANLVAYRLDCRLDGLATARDLRYTRYADDLAFSGDFDFAHGFDNFHVLVAHIALDEGFALNTRKTRLMGQSNRQQLAGVVVNQGTNIRRNEYDCLKAVLYNCARFGPSSQNRNGHREFRAHLTGRVAQMAHLNPVRGERLYALLRRIDWSVAEG